MSEEADDYTARKAELAHRRLDEHESVHEKFDRRITVNENWRLQAQGALKAIALMLGAGGLAVAFDWFVNLF